MISKLDLSKRKMKEREKNNDLSLFLTIKYHDICIKYGILRNKKKMEKLLTLN